MIDDIYVVVAENNLPIKSIGSDENFYDNKGPIVFEQYIKDASLKNAIKKSSELSGRYGKTRVAKLVFLDKEINSAFEGGE